MYSHILLPVELGGDTDYKDAKAIADTILNDGGRITILHAIEPVPQFAESYISPEVGQKVRENAGTTLKEMAKDLGVKDTALIHGSVGRSIVDWVEENSADCIVMPSHTPVLSDIFLGSTAAWVVRHARCAVHVLR